MLFLLFVVIFLLTACAARPSNSQQLTVATHNPTAEEILQHEPDADIFMSGDIVYRNAKDTKWVQQEKIGSLKGIGEIQSRYDGRGSFENKMATKLPPDTKLFAASPSTLIIVAEVNGEQIRYLGLVEG
ncbi:hypothetical protein [Paenibacillus sp. DMB20]|uniref:hypothetical protein n=1 Tax=Paenibacillus sp. DMB20 TaxID=1642570 RepID=UPI0006279ABE|nr:hypothetical protein [Paenibacillus sp. DMB20]KKO52668.1 hypothetical protein XI25_18665 [Paenibacillus sp. DMB20]